MKTDFFVLFTCAPQNRTGAPSQIISELEKEVWGFLSSGFLSWDTNPLCAQCHLGCSASPVGLGDTGELTGTALSRLLGHV